MSKFSQAFIQHTQATWQDRYLHGLSEVEACEIASSVTNFVEVLSEWEEKIAEHEGKGKP